MVNTSVSVNSSMLDPFQGFYCLKENHVGTIVDCVIILLCFFLGTPAHFWFLWFSLRAGWKIKPTQVFFLNHTVLDLIYCTHCALVVLNLVIFHSATFWQEIYIFLYLCCVGRPLMQICICVEQYLAVLHPIIFLKYKGIQYRIALALLVWLTVAVYVIYVVLNHSFPDPFFYFIFLTAVAVISFCCVSVLRALKRPGPGDTQITVQRGRDVGNQQKRNAFKTIFSGLFIILLSYVPQASRTILIAVNTKEDLFTCDIVPLIYCLHTLGVMITPFLKMYRDGHLKCINHQMGSNVGSIGKMCRCV